MSRPDQSEPHQERDHHLLLDCFLGELPPGDRRVLESRLAAEPALASQWQQLQGLILGIAGQLGPVSLTPEFRARIRTQLAQQKASALRQLGPAAAHPGLFDRIRQHWLWAGPSAGFALGLSAAVLLLPAVPTPDAQQQDLLLSQTRLLAALTPLSADRSEVGPQAQPIVARWVVEQLSDGSLLVRPVRPQSAGAGRVLQVWTKQPGADRPVSLGLATAEGVLRVQPETIQALQPVSGQLFELTEEPLGGSPTGLPTGPVVAIGRVM